MFAIRVIGALLLAAGIVYLVLNAIRRGRMSEPGPTTDSGAKSLEPRQSGLSTVGAAAWPGLALVGAGIVLLLLPAFFATPPSP